MEFDVTCAIDTIFLKLISLVWMSVTNENKNK